MLTDAMDAVVVVVIDLKHGFRLPMRCQLACASRCTSRCSDHNALLWQLLALSHCRPSGYATYLFFTLLRPLLSHISVRHVGGAGGVMGCVGGEIAVAVWTVNESYWRSHDDGWRWDIAGRR